MIGIASLFYDLAGYVAVQRMAQGSQLLTGARRATRYGTLDGGAKVYDGGYSPSDETLLIIVEPASQNLVDTIVHLGESYQQVKVSTRRGVYNAVLARWSLRETTLEFEIDLVEKTSA